MFERTLWQPAWWAGRSTVEIWTTARLAYFLISMKAIVSEKIPLTDMQSLKTVCEGIKKSPASQDTLTTRLVNGNKHCPNMENASINSYWSLWRQLRWSKSLLLICKVLKLFLTALIKNQFDRTLWEAAWLTVTSTVQIWRTPPLTVTDHCEGNCVGENLSYSYPKS